MLFPFHVTNSLHSVVTLLLSFTLIFTDSGGGDHVPADLTVSVRRCSARRTEQPQLLLLFLPEPGECLLSAVVWTVVYVYVCVYVQPTSCLYPHQAASQLRYNWVFIVYRLMYSLELQRLLNCNKIATGFGVTSSYTHVNPWFI